MQGLPGKAQYAASYAFNADPSTNNTDKEVALKTTPPPSVLVTHASGSFNSEQCHAFDCGCARL